MALTAKPLNRFGQSNVYLVGNVTAYPQTKPYFSPYPKQLFVISHQIPKIDAEIQQDFQNVSGLSDDGHITRDAMNGFSFSDICCLLCCPPVPSRIAAKLAFVPPEPSYAIITKESGSQELVLTDKAEWQFNDRELGFIDAFTTRSSRGNKIACIMVRPVKNPLFTILFSHGNAVDLGQMSRGKKKRVLEVIGRKRAYFIPRGPKKTKGTLALISPRI
eukprot:sb/3469911/